MVVAILSISFPLVEVDDGHVLVLLRNLFLMWQQEDILQEYKDVTNEW